MLDGNDATSAAFEAWRRESPLHAAAYDRVRAARGVAHRLADDPSLFALRHETLARTVLARPPSRLQHRAAAAAMLLLAGAPLAALSVHNWARPPAAEATTESFRTGIGQQADVTLPDGSIVTLDTASRLDVRFAEGQRHVRIAGQGWFRIKPSTVTATLTKRSLLAPGGLRTTTVHTSQQWDEPNGWAPLLWIGVSGLDRTGHPALADDLARRWVRTVSTFYACTGRMVEKYDVDSGKAGGGGEYPVQDGFGWTNGVTRSLLDRPGMASAITDKCW
jgi:hypothetical protein